MHVLILGAGGHGQVVADILLRMVDAGGALTVVGYLDDDPRLAGQRILDLPVLGRFADRESVHHDGVVVAVGDNKRRQQLVQDLAAEGERFATARHPRAVIAPDVVIGSGSMVCGGVVVNPGSVIGAHVILNTSCTADHHNHICDFAHVAPGAHLGGDVRIGVGALVGLGANVMPQRSVGDWSVIGAGSLVSTNIPSNIVAIGIPARAHPTDRRHSQREVQETS